ncbi:carbohydrate kinase [Chitinophaga lutea]|uniref:Carbohydrate kinase n=1 Tax=Chitinophaga lutea TaxID=2488634 RepID=A0A3N4PIK7_9BACT|nr:FGGY-family carbohydrate kinase [Chitinophaga lutea]RPE08513.1 carbohydrate kinase [Chitinophaga lutea]
MDYFIGIDVGTQGARVLLADETGRPVAAFEEQFPLHREEQDPEHWWAACLRCLEQLPTGYNVKAIAVTSTSGTIIPLGRNGLPLHNAIMYSDGRQAEQGARCRQLALAHHPDGYTGFNTSSGLPKMLWFIEQYPHKTEQLYKFIHAADYITGKLCGRFDRSDFTNVLKSGYDVEGQRWPEYIWEKLPLRREWLQEAVPSGTPLGPVTARIKGLPDNVMVVAGMTDGCASQVASGAVNPGDWNTTIGTTLVVKGVTLAAVKDPEDRLYSHRHPEGYWMPGGASNTGADWVTKLFAGRIDALNEAAAQLCPTPYLVYPLLQRGERFPFVAPQAEGFATPGLSDEEHFTAAMEGVAYIEKLAYEMIEKLSGEKVKAVYTAGGASNSNVWLHIRSNVLNLPLYKMQQVSGAAGAAILAASKTRYRSVMEAAAAMAHTERIVRPQAGITDLYTATYHRFKQQLTEKGYIPEQTYA